MFYPTSMSKVSIIIVNWNTGKLLRECVQSIIELPEAMNVAEVIIIDNASSDTSFAEAKELVTTSRLKETFRFIASPQNIGFAQANNLGIRERRWPHTHVLLLNPDTRLAPGSVTELPQALKRHPRTGIVGPKLLNSDGSLQPSVRRFPTLPIFLLWFLKLHRLFAATRFWRHYAGLDIDYRIEQPVDQVMGAAFLIRDTVVTQVGFLDEKFWVWFEEVDYCQRVVEAGWQVLYTPRAEVLHHGGVSFNQLIGPRRVLPFLKSALHYAHKHLHPVSTGILIILYPIAALLSLPAAIFHLGRS